MAGKFASKYRQDVLNTFAERVTKLAKVNLGARRTYKDTDGRTKRKVIDNSGTLRNSLAYILDVTPNAFSLQFLMEEYGAFVDSGRDGSQVKQNKKGTLNEGAGSGAFMPKDNLSNWIRTKPIRYRDENGAFKRATESERRGLQFIINRKIKEKGIAPTRFFSEPFSQEFETLPDDIVEAFGLDIDDFLKFTTDGNNI